jgi:hypothetical protein
MHGRYASRVEHVWMDHFNVIGPAHNPALLDPADTLESAIDKIMLAPGAFWLTRDDLSAINCKETHAVLEHVNRRRAAAGLPLTTPDALKREGREALAAEAAAAAACARCAALASADGDPPPPPAALAAARAELARAARALEAATSAADGVCKRGFYRPARLLPLQATRRAAALGYYTMSDHGVFHALPPAERPACAVFVDGRDPRHQPALLNPADALLPAAPTRAAADFVRWLRGPAAQSAVAAFAGRAGAAGAALYRPADPAYARDRAARQALAAAAGGA